jgi:hypothetical protein
MKKPILLVIFSLVLLFAKSQTLTVNPNPFSQRTLASYTISVTDSVSLYLMNVIGQTIVSPVSNTVLTAGTYQDSLILDSYPPGVYFLVLKVKSSTAKTVKIVKEGLVGINEISGTSQIKIYPNPIHDLLYYDLKILTSTTISIHNNLGEIVYAKNLVSNSGSLDTSFLPCGIYFLKLQSNSEQKVFKILKE